MFICLNTFSIILNDVLSKKDFQIYKQEITKILLFKYFIIKEKS